MMHTTAPSETVSADAAASGASGGAFLTPHQVAALMGCVLVVAVCGIVYELLIATVSSYLLGNSVYQFSITIGLFMFAMGVGAYLSKKLEDGLLAWFVGVELLLALLGGFSSTLLFLVFPYAGLYVPTMYGLILAVGAMVGLEVPILVRVIAQPMEEGGGAGQGRASVRESLAHVLSLDYLGALVGSVAFPLVLLPHLGLLRSGFAVGLLNAGVALATAVVLRGRVRQPGRMIGVCALAAATLAAGLLGATRLIEFAEGRLFADPIVYREQTPYQRIVITRAPVTGEHRLYLDGHIQFAQIDEYRYHEALVHPLMSAPGGHARVLILGGGDGLAAREVLRYDDVQRIDLVDLDPAVTALGASFPPFVELNGGSLHDPRVHVHHTDAFSFLLDPPRRYDRIIMDLPDPHDAALSKLYSVEFYRLAAQALTPGGLVVTQASSPFFTRRAYWCIRRTMEAAGYQVTSYHAVVPSFGGMWGFHLGGPAGAPDRLRADVPTRYLTPALLEAAQVFGADAGPVPTPVNSIFRPVLYRLYYTALSGGRLDEKPTAPDI